MRGIKKEQLANGFAEGLPLSRKMSAHSCGSCDIQK